MQSIQLPAYAKLNLTLDILRRREDGYHDMSMVMQSVALHDDIILTLEEGKGIHCHIAGADLPTDEKNLAVKAALAFAKQTGLSLDGLSIMIHKRIPMQAGMAGGSTDAAAVLKGLRSILAPQLPLETLEKIGADVGSDVPYCIRGGTALAEGRGEVLTTLPEAPHFYVVCCFWRIASRHPRT